MVTLLASGCESIGWIADSIAHGRVASVTFRSRVCRALPMRRTPTRPGDCGGRDVTLPTRGNQFRVGSYRRIAHASRQERAHPSKYSSRLLIHPLESPRHMGSR